MQTALARGADPDAADDLAADLAHVAADFACKLEDCFTVPTPLLGPGHAPAPRAAVGGLGAAPDLPAPVGAFA